MSAITRQDEPLICECCNCTEASVDNDGDVWVQGPQPGHWLSDERMAEYLIWRSANYGE